VCRSGKANNVKNCLRGGLFYHPILIRTTACNNDSSSFSVTTFLYSVCPPCRGVWVCTGWRGGDVPNYRAPLPVGHAYTVVVVRRTSYGDTSTFINICTTVVSPSRTLPAYRIFLLLHPHRGHYLGPSQLYSLLLHCSMLWATTTASLLTCAVERTPRFNLCSGPKAILPTVFFYTANFIRLDTPLGLSTFIYEL
jgi:hypothetical protein